MSRVRHYKQLTPINLKGGNSSGLLSALGSLQTFDLIWVMTLGGPIHASEVMATYLWFN